MEAGLLCQAGWVHAGVKCSKFRDKLVVGQATHGA